MNRRQFLRSSVTVTGLSALIGVGASTPVSDSNPPESTEPTEPVDLSTQSDPSYSARDVRGIRVYSTVYLNTRYRPGLESRVLATMAPRTAGELMNGPVYEDGYTWWGVHWLDSGIWGWSVGKYLRHQL